MKNISNSNKTSLLNELRIASPCPKRWEDMQVTEEEAVRFCQECRKNVYDVASMSQSEAQLLLQEAAVASQGRVCLQLFRRADGTVITDDCPVGLRRVRRLYRRVKAACAAFTALILAHLLPLPTSAQVVSGSNQGSERERGLRGEACPLPMPGGMRPPGIEAWRQEALSRKSISLEVEKLATLSKNTRATKSALARQHLAVAQVATKEKLPIFAKEYLIQSENMLVGTAGSINLLKQVLQARLENARLLGENQQEILEKLKKLKGAR